MYFSPIIVLFCFSECHISGSATLNCIDRTVPYLLNLLSNISNESKRIRNVREDSSSISVSVYCTLHSVYSSLTTLLFFRYRSIHTLCQCTVQCTVLPICLLEKYTAFKNRSTALYSYSTLRVLYLYTCTNTVQHVPHKSTAEQSRKMHSP